jgi:hypothetical protein
MLVILYLWKYSGDQGLQIFSLKAAYCPALTWSSLGNPSQYSEYSQKSRKRDSILRRGKRFFFSVKSTDRSWSRCDPLSSRVSITNFLTRTAGGMWIGPPPLFSAQLKSAKRCGSALLRFFTALCLVKCSESCTLHRTIWCNLIHTLMIYRLTCWHYWLTLLNNHYLCYVYFWVWILVAARSKALACDRSFSGVAGLNLARGVVVCLLRVLCVSSGRGLCNRPITRPEESYWIQCLTEYDLEISKLKAWAH